MLESVLKDTHREKAPLKKLQRLQKFLKKILVVGISNQLFISGFNTEPK